MVKTGKHEVQKRETDNPYMALPKKQIETYKVCLENTSFQSLDFNNVFLLLYFQLGFGACRNKKDVN